MKNSIMPNQKKRRSAFRRRPGDVIFDIVNVTMFVLFTLICVFPFYYLFINTISDNDLVSKGAISFYPIGINISNYIALKDVSDLGNAFVVTVTRTVFGTALMVVVSGFAGYLFTNRKLWHRSLWYRFVVVTMYFNAGLIPWYLNMLMLGLTNNYLAYIIPGAVSPFNIILAKTYIESIPSELEESAVIDGASTFTIFRRIIWPISKPILATIAVFGAVGNWNSFQDSLILMKGAPHLYTLQHRLYVYLVKASDLEAVMAGGAGTTQVLENSLNSKVVKYTIAMATIIPIMLVYPFMQRYFVKGIMLGAVKG